jgi:hypothetical protein
VLLFEAVSFCAAENWNPTKKAMMATRTLQVLLRVIIILEGQCD